MSPSCWTSAQTVSWEWMTPFGLAVVPEVHPMRAGDEGSTFAGDARGASSARSENRLLAAGHLVVGDHELEIGQVRHGFQIGQEVLMPEPRGRDVDPRSALLQDVRRLAAPVDVDDGRRHRTEQRGPVERHHSLDPVRSLERDDVTGAHALGGESGRHPAGQVEDVGERASPRTRAGVDHEVLGALRRQGGGHPLAHAVARPPPLGAVPALVFRRDLPQGPPGSLHDTPPIVRTVTA